MESEEWGVSENYETNNTYNQHAQQHEAATDSGWGDWGNDDNVDNNQNTTDFHQDNGYNEKNHEYLNKSNENQNNTWDNKNDNNTWDNKNDNNTWGNNNGNYNNENDNWSNKNGNYNNENENWSNKNGNYNNENNNWSNKNENETWNNNEKKSWGNNDRQESRNNYNKSESRNNFNNEASDFGNNGFERREPITYEPAHLNYDEKYLFEKKVSGGIDFSNYDKIDVEMTGGDGSKFDHISNFESCNLHPKIFENVQRSKYITPTPIQKSVIPIITKTDHDIMACAQTGSGKTAAFVLPIFSKMLETGIHLEGKGYVPSPTVLLIGPTRELINQLFVETEKFAWGTGINCARVYGGVSRQFLLRGLNNNCNVLSATPGRLLAFLKNGEISLENVKYLILDEADRMLDMGFIGDIKRIIESYGLPSASQRRCYMFSATFPDDVQKLAAEILNPNFYFVAVGMVGGAAETIAQSIEKLPVTQKRERLVEILKEISQGTKILIFTETKRQADYLTIYLCESGFNAISIHGDRLQQQREQALEAFVNGTSTILVATSVAARGLDIPSVDIVLNFDLPKDADEYVHRIGRTGRIGNRGLSISFFQEGRDEHLASDLLRILKNANQQIPDWLELLTGSGYSSASNYRQKDVRYGNNNDQSANRYKFNAMDSNPYPKPSRNNYENGTADAWQSTSNTGAMQQVNDEEELW